MSDHPHPWGPRLPGVSPGDYEARRELDDRMDRDRLGGGVSPLTSPPPKYLKISLQEAIDIYLAAARAEGRRPTGTVKGSKRRFGGPTMAVFTVDGYTTEGSTPTLNFGEDGLIYQGYTCWAVKPADYEAQFKRMMPDLKQGLLLAAGVGPHYG